MQRRGGGGGRGGLRGSAEDHPVVELPIFRRWQILGLNKAGTTAEDHGGCGVVALRLSQGTAPGGCVLDFPCVFIAGFADGRFNGTVALNSDIVGFVFPPY